MRQADLNRVNKAKEHLKAAAILLGNIKHPATRAIEQIKVNFCKEHIDCADHYLEMIIELNNNGED